MMFSYLFAATLAATTQPFENLQTLDKRISQVDASAQPVDARLKLAVCPVEPIIASPVNGAIVVRCEPMGWRLRVPVKAQLQSNVAGQILVRKGEIVECIDAGAGFAVSTSMIALEDGVIGQAIRVKSSTSQAAVTATITARGVVSF